MSTWAGDPLAAVARRRLRASGLDGDRRFTSAEDVVRWSGVVQGQEYLTAKWGLAQRLSAATDASVEAEFDSGRLVRTHVLRPTWHFVAVDELPWLLDLTGARVARSMAYYDRQVGATPELDAAARPVIADALAGGVALTRKQLTEHLAAAGIDATGTRLAHLMMHAEVTGLVCSGPRAGRQHSYQLLEERLAATGLTAWTPSSREEALARLVVTYFRSHGPATSKDFRWWSGLTAKDLTIGLDAAGDAVREIMVDGVRFWCTDDGTADWPEPDRVRLIQPYDEYTVAVTESRKAVQLALTAAQVGQAQQPALLNTVLAGTQVAGHWKAVTTARTVRVPVQTYGPVTDHLRDGAEAEARRLAVYLGLEPAGVEIGSLTD